MIRSYDSIEDQGCRQDVHLQNNLKYWSAQSSLKKKVQVKIASDLTKNKNFRNQSVSNRSQSIQGPPLKPISTAAATAKSSSTENNIAFAFTQTFHSKTSQNQFKNQYQSKISNSIVHAKLYEQHIIALYQRQVKGNMKAFRELRQNLLQKIECYKGIKKEKDSMHLVVLQREIIQKQIHSLDQIGNVEIIRNKVEYNMVNSQHQLKRSHIYALQRQPSDASFIYNLCNYYQCSPTDLQKEIQQQSKLIQFNLNYLFQRLIQTLFSVKKSSSNIIFKNQIQRIQRLMSHCFYKNSSIQIKQQDFSEFNESYQSHLMSMSNYTAMQMKSPYLQVVNESTHRQGKLLDLQSILTVFVHGYKGNQYDLSKVKAYLTLLFGFHNFYSIKGLSSQQIVDQNISKLAAVAAKEINQYLALNPHLTTINIISFSLGGIIARALVPEISEHHSKLNLLMTIASPHLGIRDIQGCLVRSGLCLMRNIFKVNSMKELNNQKNGKQQFFMQKLASKGGIQHFRWVVLVGSPDDGYVPLYSSLVDYSGQDAKTSLIFDIFGQKMKRAIRCSVRLHYEQSCWQMITKRKAHILFLQDDNLIRQILVKFSYCFLSGKTS